MVLTSLFVHSLICISKPLDLPLSANSHRNSTLVQSTWGVFIYRSHRICCSVQNSHRNSTLVWSTWGVFVYPSHWICCSAQYLAKVNTSSVRCKIVLVVMMANIEKTCHIHCLCTSVKIERERKFCDIVFDWMVEQWYYSEMCDIRKKKKKTSMFPVAHLKNCYAWCICLFFIL